MNQRSVTHSTFVIERHYAVPPARVFSAFSDPEKKRRWFGESESMEFEEFTMDFRPGGAETRSSRFKAGSPFPGTLLTNRTVYQDIVADRRIVFAYTMSLGDRRISASLATIELVPSGSGTSLIFTDQGAYFEGSDGPERRQHGWQALLDGLAKESEPEHAAVEN